MELLTITIFLFSFYTLCFFMGINRPIKIFLLIIGFLMVVLSAYLTYYDTLAKPKEVSYEFFRQDDSVQVVAFSIEPGVALYTLLRLENVEEPRYYKFDWSESTKEMAKALLEGQENNEKMRISKPFERSLSPERVAHPEPQPRMPDKQLPKNNIIKLEEEN